MMKWTFRIFAGLLILSAVVWFGGRMVLSFSTADYDGNESVSGLTNPVEVTFDSKGIPQIWAKTNDDLFFTVGYLHASERLFQMELVRRFSRGELSELFGADAFEIDVRQRRLGFADKAKNELSGLKKDDLHLLQKYCDGINEWVKNKTILPPEFVILNHSPRLWTPEECLSILIYQTWFAHELMDKDLEYTKLISKLGPDVRRLLKEYKNWSPSTVPASFLSSIFSEESFPGQMTKASNSWVISPNKSVSGSALHASDPHLQVNQIPGFWYAMGFHSDEGIHAIGVTAASLPFVAMGHNDSVAWAFTVASVDIIDYYNEYLSDSDSTVYLSASGLKKMTFRDEAIAVKGEDHPRVVRVYQTDNDPVMEHNKTTATSLHWAGFDFSCSEMLSNIFQLMKVRHFEDFRSTVTKLGALDVNWTYSDKKGNIGYQLGSPVPIRNYKNTFEPLPGNDSLFKWLGYRKLNETPYVYNPKEGFAVTCNNQVAPKEWPYDLPGFYDEYRIVRANQLLSQTAQFSQSSTEQMQMDIVSSQAVRWKWLMAEGAQLLGRSDLAAEINHWNGEMKGNLTTPTLYSMWWKVLAKFIYEDDLNENWRSGRVLVEDVLSEKNEWMIDDRRTPDKKETIVDISASALNEVLGYGEVRKWSEVSSLTAKHPLSMVKVLDLWLDLNRGPVSVDGDFASINPSYFIYNETEKTFKMFSAASMRFVLDWSNIDGFTLQTNMGQSGNPFSDHYDDFLNDWKSGSRHVLPFSREKVYEMKTSLLTLNPNN